MKKENPDLQYHVAWSNECIEFWFLLHFSYYTSNNHRTKYISFLNDKFRELGIGNPNLAIRYAKKIIEGGKGKTPAEIAP